MPNYAILGISKQKGASVALSGHHNDRTRSVPNADPERSHLNRVLAGDDRNVREIVTEIIDEHGGKPRKDSVEAIEILCKASPPYFKDKDPARRQEKLEAFVEQAMQFLRDERSGGKLAKAVLHLDERTPHIHAHKVPIDPEGKLNARHYTGGREKMEAMHDLYAEYMKPLGLERGRRRSRTTHERLEEFYRSIDQPVRLEVDHDEIPDPPKVLITENERKKYKDKVIRAVLKGLEEPHRIMRDQAMLAKDERAHREEAERRAEAAERQVAERVAAAERAAQEQIAAYKREAQEHFDNLWRSARQIREEKEELERENQQLLKERSKEHDDLLKMTLEKQEFQMLARKYSDRLADIPMHEVMEHLGYENEHHGERHVYRGEKGEVAMVIEKQRAFDDQRQLICKNSLDLVVHMRRENEGVEGFNHTHALEWLRSEFGEKRAKGAAVARGEQEVLDYFDRRREERERVQALVRENSRDPWRSPQGRGEDHDRGSRGGHDDDRGGGRSYTPGGR